MPVSRIQKAIPVILQKLTKNTAKLYGDALLYTAVFIDWLDLSDWLDSRIPAVFIDWLDSYSLITDLID